MRKVIILLVFFLWINVFIPVFNAVLYSKAGAQACGFLPTAAEAHKDIQLETCTSLSCSELKIDLLLFGNSDLCDPVIASHLGIMRL